MGFWSKLFRSAPLLEGTTPRQRSSIASPVVTPAEAAILAPVFEAATILATSVEQIDLDYDGQDRASRLFVARPDPAMPRATWLHEIVVSLALHGNAFCRVTETPGGIVARIMPNHMIGCYLDPHTLTRRYAVGGREIDAREILHFQWLHRTGEPLGLGPIQAAQPVLSFARDTLTAAGQWYTGSGIPAGVLSTKEPLTDEEAQVVLDQWNAIPAGKTRVLPYGLAYEHVRLSPRDAQFLESRRFSRTEIFGLFGIPSSLLLGIDAAQSDAYRNVEQEWTGFVRFRLMRLLGEIETMIENRIKGEARFRLESLLRADSQTRMGIHATAIASGIYSPAHARDIERIPATAAPEQDTSACTPTQS